MLWLIEFTMVRTFGCSPPWPTLITTSGTMLAVLKGGGLQINPARIFQTLSLNGIISSVIGSYLQQLGGNQG